jgi:hypothetical protein
MTKTTLGGLPVLFDSRAEAFEVSDEEPGDSAAPLTPPVKKKNVPTTVRTTTAFVLMFKFSEGDSARSGIAEKLRTVFAFLMD